MEKKLLTQFCLLLNLACFSQQSNTSADKPFSVSGKADYADLPVNLADRKDLPAPAAQTNEQDKFAAKSAQAAITWQRISSSMNAFGVVEKVSKPLQYNDELNAISFIQRKSPTYTSLPSINSPAAAVSGIIVAMVSANQGLSWDSTNVWSNQNWWARFPQGGLYNPTGNSSLANAHVVACGPIVNANGFTGSYLASKPLSQPGSTVGFNNISGTVTGMQQYFPNTSPFLPATGKFDFPSIDFCTTDDGNVRTLALLLDDINKQVTGPIKFRGAKILKGTFTSGIFNWNADSIIPTSQTIVNSNLNYPQLLIEPHMAWNESGTVGYVVFFGGRLGAVGSNKGIQPMVYKTTNSGATWALMPPIDFNSSPVFQSKVLGKLKATYINSNLTIPFFNVEEGIDCVVDGEDRLHIVSTLRSTWSSHNDSLQFAYLFDHADGEKYKFQHVPGKRPYIYDFIETTNGWNVELVDSMPSEAPGGFQNSPGFSDNPWDATGNGGGLSTLGRPQTGIEKANSSARIHASRTPDGKYIVYTWAESDSSVTPNKKKWNNRPNIKARAYDVFNKSLSLNEVDLTPLSASALVSSKAHLHHTSPRCIFVSKTTSNVELKIPVTVTNNQNTPLTQHLVNDNYFSCSNVSFVFLATGLADKAKEQAVVSVFPNPAENRVTLSFNSNVAAIAQIELYNNLGRQIKKVSASTSVGNNTVEVDLSDFEKGIYFVNILCGEKTFKGKLLKQ